MNTTWLKVKNISYRSELAIMRAIAQVIRVKLMSKVRSIQTSTDIGTMTSQDLQNLTGMN